MSSFALPADRCVLVKHVSVEERGEQKIRLSISFGQSLTQVYNPRKLFSVFTVTCFLQL